MTVLFPPPVPLCKTGLLVFNMPPKSKSDTKHEDDYVSLSQVSDLLQQQKEMFTALMQQQKDSFEGFVKIILDSSNTRLDKLSNELHEIKTSLQFTQKEVDDIKMGMEKHSENQNSFQTDIMKICDSLLTVTDKLEYLEGQTKQNNLIFDGIEESPSEVWTESERKIKKVLSEKLHLQHDIELERVYRTGKQVDGKDRPRSIIVKFQKNKDKFEVLQKTKCLKGTNIFINEDYTEAVRLRRKELLPKMKAARDRGDIAFLRHDKLIIRPRSSTPKPPCDI